MADITMCLNQQCPLRGECYRATATPSEYRQSYATFKYTLTPEGPDCNHIYRTNKYQ